jgi:putative ATP-binding cassette transporter
LARGFWTGETRPKAWFLTFGVLVFVLANLGAALGVNRWNRFFFDALEKKDTSTSSWASRSLPPSLLARLLRPSASSRCACACSCVGGNG